MFSPYFPFSREPFSRELAPTEVFVSEGHEELRVRLRHAIETGSLAVVTGQVGSGKSTALRTIMHALDASRYRYIYLANSQLISSTKWSKYSSFKKAPFFNLSLS